MGVRPGQEGERESLEQFANEAQELAREEMPGICITFSEHKSGTRNFKIEHEELPGKINYSISYNKYTMSDPKVFAHEAVRGLKEYIRRFLKKEERELVGL